MEVICPVSSPLGSPRCCCAGCTPTRLMALQRVGSMASGLTSIVYARMSPSRDEQPAHRQDPCNLLEKPHPRGLARQREIHKGASRGEGLQQGHPHEAGTNAELQPHPHRQAPWHRHRQGHTSAHPWRSWSSALAVSCSITCSRTTRTRWTPESLSGGS